MVCTAGEAKLVRCANGAVLDVVVDAWPGSATFGQVMSFLLDDQVCTQVYVPRGFLPWFPGTHRCHGCRLSN